MNESRQAHLALFGVALIYGANYTIAREVLVSDSIQPQGFILFRVISGVFLFGLLYHGLIREKVWRKDVWLFALCGLFGVCINQIFFFRGLKLTGPIHASLIMTTTPIIVLVVSAFAIGERITWQKILGIAIGATGAVLLISHGQEVSFQSDQLWGDLQILINATSYGIYIVLVKSLMKRYHPFTVMYGLFIFGFFFVFPFGIQEALSVNWPAFTPGIWLGFVYVLLFTTFLTYLLNGFALKRLNASVVSIYIYLQPLLASTIALLLGKDEATVLKLAAAALIFVGVYLVSQPFYEKEAKNDVTN